MKFICSKCGYSGDGPDFPHPRSFDGRDCSYVARRAPKFVATDRAPQIPEPAVDATRLLAESQAHNAKLEADWRAAYEEKLRDLLDEIENGRKLEAQVERMRDQIDGMRICLEIIGLGDSENPQEDAAATLVELGLWLPEAVAARSALAASGQDNAQGEQA